MRPAVLSVSTERVIAPIRNAVLAHAGYCVIPAITAQSALRILRARHVCAMIIANSIAPRDCRMLCWEGQKQGVPSVVLDPYEGVGGGQSELHINPLDGPEGFLDALATVMLCHHQVGPDS
jgi:hypothetical protein